MERLKRRKDFRAAAAGCRTAAPGFALQVRRRSDDGAPRVGFTVSRQVGNAVERNRVRRRLREMVRLMAGGTASWRAGHDYVVVGRRPALALPFGELMQDLDRALGRIHRRKAETTGAAAERPLHEARQTGAAASALLSGPIKSKRHQPTREH